jgi:hypothetical protein
MSRRVLAFGFVPVVGAVVGSCGARTPLFCPRDVPIVERPANFYLVLDHSASMADHGKWDSLTTAASALVKSVGAASRFGAAMFPTHSECGAGSEIMSLRPGGEGAAAALASAMSAVPPEGGTPTASTLEGLLTALPLEDGHTFVILATDGGPNCNSVLTCDVAHCTNNLDSFHTCVPGGPNCCDDHPAGCIDGDATVRAALDLRAAGMPTFVIGVPGSEAYASVLARVAEAGGTARSGAATDYYRVEGTDGAALAAALKEVASAARVSPCEVDLARSVIERYLRVLVGGAPVPESAQDGFTARGPHLELHGSACNAVRGGAALRVSEIVECFSRGEGP